jgi:hypothetical protein
LQKLSGTLGQVFTENQKRPTMSKRLLKMKKYNEEYFSVIETKTGRKIADCGEEEDALMMVSFDPQNRTITKNKFLMGPVVDVEIPKALPTTEIVAVHTASSEKFDEYMDNLIEPRKVKLPEGQGEPVRV